MTIRKALEVGVKKLQAAHTHDPRACAKFLLRHATAKVTNNQQSVISLDKLLVTDPSYELNAECWSLFTEMLNRRAKHEPAWYITNEAFFWKDVFHVDQRVLIPRPETELLVEKALKWIRQRSIFAVADVGTGSGAIAISIYKELTGSIPVSIYASDLSPEAIDVARLNAKRLETHHIHFLVGDALNPLPEKVDLILGNPPYIPSETIGGLSYDIHHFEPRVALDGGPDGLAVHKQILNQAQRKLKRGGAIFLEIGHDQGQVIRKISLHYFRDAKISIIQDYEEHDRILKIETGGTSH